MRLAYRGTIYEGRAIDLRGQDPDGRLIAAAIRGQRRYPVVSPTASTAVYQYCGHIHPGMGLRTRTALAMAARSRGYVTEFDDRIAELRTKVRSTDPEEPSLPARREQVSDETIAELREAVATERGRLEAYRELDVETADIATDIRDTTRRLAERETERTAAMESRYQRREAARAYRDRIERRRRLADELENRQRDARAELVEKAIPIFEAALASLPRQTPSDPFDVSPIAAGLAILRLAETEAPVVLETDWFPNPAAGAEYLGVPVVRC